MSETVGRFGQALTAGTVLVSAAVDEPQLLIAVTEEVVDGAGEPVGRRFDYVYVDAQGSVTGAGPAPHLDAVAVPETPAVSAARALPWLADAEPRAISWIIAHQLPEFLADVAPRRTAELTKIRTLVTARLRAESERLLLDAAVAAEQERQGDNSRSRRRA